MHVLRFGNKLNEEVCRGFIFANLFNSLYLLVRLWWNILVANLATNFQDLVAKVKNLVALAPVLGAISRPELSKLITWHSSFKLYFLWYTGTHQIFGWLRNVVPLWTVKMVSSLHYWPQHGNLPAMPEGRAAHKPVKMKWCHNEHHLCSCNPLTPRIWL